MLRETLVAKLVTEVRAPIIKNETSHSKIDISTKNHTIVLFQHILLREELKISLMFLVCWDLPVEMCLTREPMPWVTPDTKAPGPRVNPA